MRIETRIESFKMTSDNENLDFISGYTDSIFRDLIKISSANTRQELLVAFKELGKSLKNFIDDFERSRLQLENKEKAKEVVKKYSRSIKEELQSKESTIIIEAEEKIICNEISLKLKQGYYIVNKIRDYFFTPIDYAVAYKDPITKEVFYLENLSLEDMMKYSTVFISDRTTITDRNFGRLEADLSKLIEHFDENKKRAKDLEIYERALALQEAGEKHQNKPLADGYLFEAVRTMFKYGITNFGPDSPPPPRAIFHGYYEGARKGNLPYWKGGDSLEEQDKFGVQIGLTSMNVINGQLKEIANKLSSDISLQEIQELLEKTFIQKVKPNTDDNIKKYIKKEKDELLSIFNVS